jgi:dTDP-4-dehydrorhamnose 3,5-epimerase
MIFNRTKIQDVLRIEIEALEDFRGFFARTYCVEEFEANGVSQPMIQNSIGFNRKTGTLRGLHYHAEEFPQTRLIRCITGALFAVIVDLRENSPTYLVSETFELSEATQTSVFVPFGIALGYQTLQDNSTVYYQMSALYDPTYERGVRWNDPAFGIDWPDSDPIILERDASYPDYLVRQGT